MSQIQRKAKPISDPVTVARQGIGGGGEPLPHLGTLQKAFGPFDLSTVRLHRDSQAQSACRSLQAEAFTHGEHIALRGEPTLDKMAHEAAHVVRQRQGGLPTGLSSPGDASERSAEAVADRVSKGGSAVGLLGQTSGQQPQSSAPSQVVQRMVDQRLVKSQLLHLQLLNARSKEVRSFLHDCLQKTKGPEEGEQVLYWFIMYTDKSLLLHVGGARKLFKGIWSQFYQAPYPFPEFDYGTPSDGDDDGIELKQKKAPIHEPSDEESEDILESAFNEVMAEDDNDLPNANNANNANDVPQDEPEELLVEDEQPHANEPNPLLEIDDAKEEALEMDLLENLQVGGDLAPIPEEDEEDDDDVDEDAQQVVDEMAQQGLMPHANSDPKADKKEDPKAKKKKQPKVDTIASCLAAAHEAYTRVESKAMMSEKLIYSFLEDRNYVTRRLEALQKQANPNDNADQQPANDVNAAPEKKLTKNERKHQAENDKMYAKQFSSVETAQKEIEIANNEIELATLVTQGNYLKKKTIHRIYLRIEKLRKEYPLQEVYMDVHKPGGKKKAKAQAKHLALIALQLVEDAEQDYARLKSRKKELIQQGRVAPEFSDAKWKWIKTKGAGKTGSAIYDFALGLGSGGLARYKEENDYRGFTLPRESSWIFKELKDNYNKIKNEHGRIKELLGDALKGFFKIADIVVELLQILDRSILHGIKRVVRFLRYYLLAISAFPPAAPVAGALAATSAVISAGIQLLQVAANAVIGSIRTVQLFDSDPVVTNLVRYSRKNAAVNGFFGAVRIVSGAAENLDVTNSEIYQDNLEKAATFNDLKNPYDQYMQEQQNSNSSSAHHHGKVYQVENESVSTIPKMTQKIGKQLYKEYDKATVDYMKGQSAAVKKKIKGDLDVSEALVDKETLELFQSALGNLTREAKPFDMSAGVVADNAAGQVQGLADAASKGAEAANDNQLKPEESEKAKEAANTAKDTGGAMKDVHGSLRLILEAMTGTAVQ